MTANYISLKFEHVAKTHVRTMEIRLHSDKRITMKSIQIRQAETRVLTSS